MKVAVLSPKRHGKTEFARSALIEQAARGKAIRELLEAARAREAIASAELAVEGAETTEEAASPNRAKRTYAPKRTDKLEPGTVLGIWTILGEAPPDHHGRVLYRARASCCGHEAKKRRHELERARSACTKWCLKRSAPAPVAAQRVLGEPSKARRRGEVRCSGCGSAGHNRATCPRATVAQFVRCKLAVPVETGAANQQAIATVACGALVFGKKLQQHLQDVHGLEVAVDQVVEYFDHLEASGQGGDE